MKIRNKIFIALMIVVLAFSSTGCYWNRDVDPSEVGVKLFRNKVESCIESGSIETDMRYFAELKRISVATLTFEVSDPEVATADNQLVGVTITIQARRKGDCDSAKSFLANWTQLLNDDALKATIDATAREGIKNGVREFTLTQLLDDRNGLAVAITNPLKEDAAKYATEIVNVTIENVTIDPEYASVLQATANLKAQEDQAKRRQGLIEQNAKTDKFEAQQAKLVLDEKLLVEEAQTLVDIEIAERAGKVTAARQAIYLENEKAFELEKLRLMEKILGDKAVFYFLPDTSDLNIFQNANGIVPVQ